MSEPTEGSANEPDFLDEMIAEDAAREALPNKSDPALIRYVDLGEPGLWIVLLPVGLVALAIIAVVLR